MCGDGGGREDPGRKIETLDPIHREASEAVNRAARAEARFVGSHAAIVKVTYLSCHVKLLLKY